MTDTRPLCDCHEVPMHWRTDVRRLAGGTWLCVVKMRAARKLADAKYDRTEKGRARTARYEALPHRRLQQTLHDMTRSRIHY